MTNVDHSTSSEADQGSARVEFSTTLGNRFLPGAWWPRSRDPESELAALVAAVPASVGRIGRIALASGPWTEHPRRVATGSGQHVRVGWFSVVDPNVATLVRVDGFRLRLLIVPPDASEQAVAEATAVATGDEEKRQCPADLLSAAGVTELPARDEEAGVFARKAS